MTRQIDQSPPDDNPPTDGIWVGRVRQRLAELGLSHSEFARHIGMKQARFSHYMQGTREPALADFMLIVSALGVSADWVLFGGSRPSAVIRSTLSARIEALPASVRRDIEGYIRVHESASVEAVGED